MKTIKFRCKKKNTCLFILTLLLIILYSCCTKVKHMLSAQAARIACVYNNNTFVIINSRLCYGCLSISDKQMAFLTFQVKKKVRMFNVKLVFIRLHELWRTHFRCWISFFFIYLHAVYNKYSGSFLFCHLYSFWTSLSLSLSSTQEGVRQTLTV